MAVHERRDRYIAFSVSPPVDRSRLLAALRSASPELRLVEYDGARGLVGCAHTDKDDAIAFLNGVAIGQSRVRTTGTSGTIRKARRKYLARRRGRNAPP